MGVALAALVGVMSFMPSMSVNANYYIVNCPQCGDYGDTDAVLNTYTDLVAGVVCQHDKNGYDYYYQVIEEVRFYCADCNLYWVEDMNAGTLMECHGN